MNLIAIETSTSCCSVAVVTGTRELQSKVSSTKGHATLLVKLLDDLLDQAKIAKNDIDCVAFGNGPGSFNGVRASASFAHGISIVNKIPVMGISTLQALAFGGIKADTKNVLAIMDARQNEIYFAAYSVHNGTLTSVLPKEHNLAKPRDIFCPEASDWILATCNWDIFQKDLPANIRDRYRTAVTEPSALSVAKLARLSFDKNQRRPFQDAMPVYLRHPVK